MGRLFLLTDGGADLHYMAEHWGRPLANLITVDQPTLLVDPSREEVEGALATSQVVAFFGHGTSRTLGVPVVMDLQNIHRATGVVVAVACRSANELGPAAVGAGAGAYVGFTDDVPVINAPEIDLLVRNGFAGLVTGEESPADFGRRFLTICESLQADYYRVSRSEDLHVVAMVVEILKLSLRVLER
jgi:hypothetical protein